MKENGTAIDVKSCIGRYVRSADLLHAYGFEGDISLCSHISEYLEKECSVSMRGNPDAHFLRFESMGIDEARDIEERASLQAFGDSRQFFILFFERITHEAQNALLKLLEEPTPQTHFYLVTPTFELLLPTLRSRLFFIPTVSNGEIDTKQAQDFLSFSVSDRLVFIKDIVETKDKVRAISLLNNLETYMHRQLAFKKPSIQTANALKEIERARGYLNDRAPSVKMLLEYIVFTLPRVV